MSTAPALLTYTRAALQLDVSTRTIRRGVAAGEIPLVQAPGTTGPRGRRIPSWFIDLERRRRRFRSLGVSRKA